ncbi:uncharacterized protein [Miscanthus floridulus]|uniref:uncharacterized protein n=1 Tax=Miscanthus floridulus TaxID=154761 RepID=UPI0034591D0E
MGSGTSGEKESMDRAFNQATGNLVWPLLTRTNYQEWSYHIQCNLEGMFLWDAIDEADSAKVERRRDRLALGAMLRGVPQEMHSMLLNKKTVKEAWEAIKTMRLGADRVKEVNAQKLLAEFESIAFKPGEAIDDFAIRITKLVMDLRGLGEESITDVRVVKKFLRVVPSRYSQVAVAIEMFKDLKKLSIEELVGHLRAAEERFEPSVEQVTEKTGKLLLTEEEWAARNKQHSSDSTSSSGGKGGGQYVKKERSGSGARGGVDARDSGGKQLMSMGTPRRKGRCRKCNIYGHFAKECKTKAKEERQEAAHHANVEAEPALMVAHICNIKRLSTPVTQHVFLNQERVFPVEYHEGAWVLDTGTTNHMTGRREAMATLDETVWGAVKFGDGSIVEIHGIGAVTIVEKNNDHRVLTEGEVVKAAAYLLNRSPTKSLNGRTPFEAWFGRKPSVWHLRTFGCTVFAKRTGPSVNKLADRSIPWVFLGYESGTKGYRVYDPVNKKLIVTRDVIFDEKRRWNWEEKAAGQSELAPQFSVVYADEVLDGTVHGPAIEPTQLADQDLDSAPQIQWATPPIGASVDSEGIPMRYRMIPDLLDSTDEVQGFEYSGLCLVASEEPATVDEALSKGC